MHGTVFTPGAGHMPPLLAGRDEVINDWVYRLNDINEAGRAAARDLVLIGPRGVGKTVTVTMMANRAQAYGFDAIAVQAVPHRVSLVDSLLGAAQRRSDEHASGWDKAREALTRLSGGTVSAAGIGVGVTLAPRPGPQRARVIDGSAVADALAVLADGVRRAHGRGGLLITVDELQACHRDDVALIAATLHRLNTDHPNAHVAFAASGLVTTRDAFEAAGVTHADRLLWFEGLPATLTMAAARTALIEPTLERGVTWESDALHTILTVSNGYPAHLQLFADAAWRIAAGPDRITSDEARQAVAEVAQRLEETTLGPQWDRMTDRQREYLAALALAGGRAPSGHIAAMLGKSAKDTSPVRADLVASGDIYPPRRGEVALTTPLLGPFILSQYALLPPGQVPMLTLAQMRANHQIE